MRLVGAADFPQMGHIMLRTHRSHRLPCFPAAFPDPHLIPYPAPFTSPAQLGYSLNPDEKYTLEELLELDLEPFQEQIDKVRYFGFEDLG